MSEVKTGLVVPNPGQPTQAREMEVPSEVSLAALKANATGPVRLSPMLPTTPNIPSAASGARGPIAAAPAMPTPTPPSAMDGAGGFTQANAAMTPAEINRKSYEYWNQWAPFGDKR